MTQEIVIAPEVQQLATTKADGWRKFGYDAAINEVQLNHDAAQVVAKYPTPTDITKIPEYEQQLAALKVSMNDIKARRMKVTAVTDAWAARQMTAEKSVIAHIEAYGAALLPLKKQAQAEADAKQARINAIASFRTMAQQEYNDLQARCQLIVNNKVADLYIRAIQSDKITTIDAAIMGQMKATLTAKDFELPPMTDPDADKQAILVEIFTNHTPSLFVSMFHELLTLKFSSFANDKKHGTEAVQQAKYEQETTTQDIAETKDMQNIAATMQGHATEQVELSHKALKEVYVLDMPDAPAAALAIMNAFIVVKGWDKLRVKSVFNTKISQMGDVLAKMKSEDNALTLTGIVFRKEQKL